MQVRELETVDPDWATSLARARHDIFQSPEYLQVEDGFRGTCTRLLVVEEGDSALLMPIIFSPLPDGRCDASSPFQYAGPTFTEGPTPQWRHEAIVALLEHLKVRGVVSLFLRSHPLLGLEEFGEFGAVVDRGPTYVIPLDRPLDEITASMRSNHRRNMRKAREAGLVAVQDTNWDHLDEFCAIYSATMDRLGASAEYRYPRDYLEHLRDDAGGCTTLWVLEMDGVVAGAHLATERDGTVGYLLGATHPDFHGRVPQVAIFEAVLRWAHARHDHDYFLGGGLQESLRHFKAGFTRSQPPAETARIIVDPVEYERLAWEWDPTNGPPAEAGCGFFPCYRTPRTHPAEPHHLHGAGPPLRGGLPS